MTLKEIICLFVWALTSLWVAIFLQKETKFFKKIKGVFLLFLLFLIGVIFHNLISGLLKKEEPFFFTLSLLSFSVGIFLFLLWFISSVRDFIEKITRQRSI
ncbi:hypothetical protein AMJ50_02420 [Parcubacteria bacterium DG_74_3]|nr:MAG: hypothetical protein AMJ50_02420 [Parcubacteria bacterium DG_74_3]